MKKTLFLSILMTSLLAACSSGDGKPMLTMNFDEVPTGMIGVVYETAGISHPEYLTPDSTGAVTFSPEVDEPVDLLIYIGKKAYGARLRPGKSTTMSFEGNNVTFSGDNVAESKFLNVYNQAYNPWNLKLNPGDTIFDLSSAKLRLTAAHDAADSLLDDIADQDIADSYKKLNDASYNAHIIALLNNDQIMNGVAHDDEVNAIVKEIDPNDDAARRSGLLTYWYRYSPEFATSGTQEVQSHFTSHILKADSLLTNNANKTYIINYLANNYLTFQPTTVQVADFMEEIASAINNVPQVKDQIDEYLSSNSGKVEDGSPLPSDPILIAPDGSKTRLSQLIGNNILYIDMWATWCVPCCNEISHLEELVNEYKDNNAIAFISISCDEDREDWLKKLSKDNPSWPNYVFEASTGNEFMDKMSAHSIPRFLLIGKDGKLISAAAPRPSDKVNVHELINSAINGL